MQAPLDELTFTEFLDLVTQALRELKQPCCEVNKNLSGLAATQDIATVTLRCTQPLPKHRIRRFEVLGSLPRSIEEIKTLIGNATTE
jgi:hypothetical protein